MTVDISDEVRTIIRHGAAPLQGDTGDNNDANVAWFQMGNCNFQIYGAVQQSSWLATTGNPVLHPVRSSKKVPAFRWGTVRRSRQERRFYGPRRNRPALVGLQSDDLKEKSGGASVGYVVMSKQIQTISIGACITPLSVLGMVLLVGIDAAKAKQCSVALPSNPQGHWSYRLIDGRKCWYEGENNFPKSLLQWPEQTPALSAFGKAAPTPEEGLLPPVPQTVSPREEPNTQSDPASFEARWRALDMTLPSN